MSKLNTSLSLALLALAFGAGTGSASAAPADSSGGGAGGTATAASGDGDVATAVDGNEGADGPSVELPCGGDLGLGCLLEALLESDAQGVGSSAMVNFVAPLSLPGLPAAEDEDQGEAEGEPEDPNAHVDRGGADGASVSVIGTGEAREVTVRGEDGTSGPAQAVAQEVAGVAGDFVPPFAEDVVVDSFSIFEQE